MSSERVWSQVEADGLAGIFVGGTFEWKWATLPKWAREARDAGRLCHVGRVGSRRDVFRAQAAGATSADSCQGLWSHHQLRKVHHALAQMSLLAGP
jgi:hypothetical protein